MTRRLRLAMLIISAAIVAVLALGVGFTAAIWTSSGSGSGENTVAPSGDSPFDWNPWAKYFVDGAVLDTTNMTAKITSFHQVADGSTGDGGYVYNSEIVIIPSDIVVGTSSYRVTEIANQIFSDDTFRGMPAVLYISPTIERIDMLAFSNLPNLTTVVFGVDGDGNGAECTVGDFAFMMCGSLVKVVTNGRVIKDSQGNAVSEASAVFMGCSDTLTVVAA